MNIENLEDMAATFRGKTDIQATNLYQANRPKALKVIEENFPDPSPANIHAEFNDRLGYPMAMTFATQLSNDLADLRAKRKQFAGAH